MEPVQKLTTNQLKDSSVSLTRFFFFLASVVKRVAVASWVCGADRAPGTAFSFCHLFVSSVVREVS